jgi:hypothetical protein
VNGSTFHPKFHCAGSHFREKSFFFSCQFVGDEGGQDIKSHDREDEANPKDKHGNSFLAR